MLLITIKIDLFLPKHDTKICGLANVSDTKMHFEGANFAISNGLLLFMFIFIKVFATIYSFETHSPNKEPLERTPQKN